MHFMRHCVAMVALWLGSFCDGEQRLLTGHRDGPAGRFRRQLPPDGWLRQRLIEQGGLGFDTSVLAALGGRAVSVNPCPGFPGPELFVTALLKVSARSCAHNDGCLTLWDVESCLQRYYYGLPLDD